MTAKTSLTAIAPDMGDFKDGITSFQSLKAPYARGGGTPATKIVEDACLQYLGKWDAANESAPAPLVAMTATGQAANHTVFAALKGGDLVASKHLFGTTKTDLKITFQHAGDAIAWVDPCDVQAFIDNTTEKTTAWFVEAVSNPAGRVPDLNALSKAAKERGILLVVDGTLAAGMPGYKGLEHADVLTASLTKQSGGGDNENIGGVIMVRQDIPDITPKLVRLKDYFADAHGQLVLPANPLGAMCSKISLHEGSGAIASRVSLSIAKSLPGLEKRVARMSANAAMLTRVLSDNPNISRVQLAGLQSDAANDARAQEYLGGNHFVLLADLKGGFDGAEKFINSQQFLHAVALGQKVTAVSHPASSTHRQYTDAERAGMGIGNGTIRISVGTEGKRDLQQRMIAALDF